MIHKIARCGAVILLLTLFAAGADSISPLASDRSVRQALQSAQQPIRRTEDIPYYVMLTLARLTGKADFKLANPNEDFNVGDAIEDMGLPFRRLAFGGISADRIFVCYVRGGLGAAFCIVVLNLDRRHHSAEPLMIAQVAPNPTRTDTPKTAKELLKAFDSGKLIQYHPTFDDF